MLAIHDERGLVRAGFFLDLMVWELWSGGRTTCCDRRNFESEMLETITIWH